MNSSSIKKQRSSLETSFSSYTLKIKNLEKAYSQLQQHFQLLKKQYEASHTHLDHILSFMTEGFLFISKEGRIVLMNTSAADMIGICLKTSLQNLFWEQFSDDFFGFSMREALRSEGMHKRIHLTVNENKEIEISTTSVLGRGLLLFLIDRTEQQQLQYSLEHSGRLKELGEMAATLAHEIRNPLGAISGFAELLRQDLTDPNHQRMTAAILEGANTLNELVTNVLEYARPLRLHFSTQDLVGLIKESSAMISLEAKHVYLNLRFAHEAYFLTLDKGRIKLVLLNLLRNAIESGATIITIMLTKEGQLIIEDNGNGISTNNINKIFTPFFTTKAKGTGLGLAEAQSVMKGHGGEISVDSQEGTGTKFSLTFSRTYAH